MWFRFPKEAANSTTREGFVDLPIDAAAWLLNFKNLNASVISQANVSYLHNIINKYIYNLEHFMMNINVKIQLKLSKTYEWSTKEITPEGSPLMEMIDLGINRVKYACEIVIALMSELKQASTAGKCKILVAIDGYNAFFSNETRVKNDAKQCVPASNVSLTQAFLDITKPDWCNGEIIVTVDRYATKVIKFDHLPIFK